MVVIRNTSFTGSSQYQNKHACGERRPSANMCGQKTTYDVQHVCCLLVGLATFNLKRCFKFFACSDWHTCSKTEKFYLFLQCKTWLYSRLIVLFDCFLSVPFCLCGVWDSFSRCRMFIVLRICCCIVFFSGYLR